MTVIDAECCLRMVDHDRDLFAIVHCSQLFSAKNVHKPFSTVCITNHDIIIAILPHF